MRKRLIERFNQESVSDSLYGELTDQTKGQLEDYINSGKFSYMGVKWTFMKRKPDIVLKKDKQLRQSLPEQSLLELNPQLIHEEVENMFSPQPLRCMFPNISNMGLKRPNRRYEPDNASKGSESPNSRNSRAISINDFNKSAIEVKGSHQLSKILITDGTGETRGKTPSVGRRSSMSRHVLNSMATADRTPTVRGYQSVLSSDGKASLSAKNQRCMTPEQRRCITPVGFGRHRQKSTNANPLNSLRASATVDPSEVIHSISSSDTDRAGLNMVALSGTLDLTPKASVDRSNFVPILVYQPEQKSQAKRNQDLKNASLVSSMLRDSTNMSLSEKLDVVNNEYDPLNKPDMSDGINPKNGRRYIGTFSALESDLPLSLLEKALEEDEMKGKRQGSFKEIQQQPKFLKRPYTKALSKALEKLHNDDHEESIYNFVGKKSLPVEYGHSILREKYKGYLEELHSKKEAETKNAKDSKNTSAALRKQILLQNQKEQRLEKGKNDLSLENIIENTKKGNFDEPTLKKLLEDMRHQRPHELGAKFLKMTFRPNKSNLRSKGHSLSLANKSVSVSGVVVKN